MKRFILIVVFGLLLLPSVSAQVMRRLNVTINVHEDGKADMGVSFRFTEEIKEVNFPLSTVIYDIETEDGKCIVKKEIKNILNCKPPSPFMVGEITIHTNFKTRGMVEKQGNISYFSVDIPILWNTDRALVIVKLPAGMVLTEDILLPISPSGVNVGSDGRRILAIWSFENKRNGDVIPIRIYYESLTPRTPIIEHFDYRWSIVLLLVVIIGMIFIYKRVSRKAEFILSVLNESERMIVDIVQKEEKKMTDQRKIVRLSGFSKAKVSRIVQSLEERGVVTVERIGRRNKITLKKRFIKE